MNFRGTQDSVPFLGDSMTLQEAITKADNLKPNNYKFPQKVDWISDVDGMIFHEIIENHENPEELDWHPYSEDSDASIRLLADDPYSELYIFYVCAKIDFYNGEYTRYANHMQSFNDKYQAFADYYNRTNKSNKMHKFRL